MSVYIYTPSPLWSYMIACPQLTPVFKRCFILALSFIHFCSIFFKDWTWFSSKYFWRQNALNVFTMDSFPLIVFNIHQYQILFISGYYCINKYLHLNPYIIMLCSFNELHMKRVDKYFQTLILYSISLK